jgi:hypothetical protein
MFPELNLKIKEYSIYSTQSSHYNNINRTSVAGTHPLMLGFLLVHCDQRFFPFEFSPLRFPDDELPWSLRECSWRLLDLLLDPLLDLDGVPGGFSRRRDLEPSTIAGDTRLNAVGRGGYLSVSERYSSRDEQTLLGQLGDRFSIWRCSGIGSVLTIKVWSYEASSSLE